MIPKNEAYAWSFVTQILCKG